MLLNVVTDKKQTKNYDHVFVNGLMAVLDELTDENITHGRYLQLLTALESLLLLMQCDIDLFIERVRKVCPGLEGRMALHRFAKVVMARIKAFDEE